MTVVPDQPTQRRGRAFKVADDSESARERKFNEYQKQADAIPILSREQFVQMFADEYTPSHFTLIGPTQRGKTTICFECLNAVLARHPKWKATILHGKIRGRDHTIDDFAKQHGYRITRTGKPGPALRPKHWKRNVKGYIVRPLHDKKLTPAEEDKLLKQEFQVAARNNYHTTSKHGPDGQPRKVVITLVDERAHADKDLKMGTDLDAPLQRGLPDNPEWNNIQRGAWCSYHCYDAPEHILLFVDDDDSNIERYAEFGVGDPEVIKLAVKRLKLKKVPTGGTISQALYMRRSDRYMCIVDF